MSDSGDSLSPLKHPYVPLPPVSEAQIKWTVHFYHPKHSDGDRTRLVRLERQVRMIISMASSLLILLPAATHACMRSQQAKEKIKTNLNNLITSYKLPKLSSRNEDSHSRIASMFLQKRHLLHILLFVFANEPLISQPLKKELKCLEALIEDDTSDWMEILDFSQMYFKCY
jgi:hypothetical protein